MEMAIVAVEIFSRFSLQPTKNEVEVTPMYGVVIKQNKEIFVNVNMIWPDRVLIYDSGSGKCIFGFSIYAILF